MKKKTLHGYYYDGKTSWELWIDDDGNIVQNSQRRAILIVKNGLIVEVRRIN